MEMKTLIWYLETYQKGHAAICFVCQNKLKFNLIVD